MVRSVHKFLLNLLKLNNYSIYFVSLTAIALLGSYWLVAIMILMNQIVVLRTIITCATRKCLVNSTCAITLCTATNSASVKLFVFSFCLHGVQYLVPFPKVKIMSLWFACLYVLHTNCLPTNWGTHLVLVSELYHLHWICIASASSVSYSHHHWEIGFWCTKGYCHLDVLPW